MSTFLEQLFESDDVVLAETRKIQELYKIKTIIRYGVEREEVEMTESVAEHTFGVLVLLSYFLPLIDPNKNLDWEKMHTMSLLHDIDEIETGDTIGYEKTEEDIKKEEQAIKDVLQKIPESMSKRIKSILDEYHKLETTEAKLVKALDKIEVNFHLFERGGKKVLERLQTTPEQHRDMKDKYVKDFPLLDRFNDVLCRKMNEQGYFTYKA